MDRLMTREEIARYNGVDAEPTKRGRQRDGRRAPRPTVPERYQILLKSEENIFLYHFTLLSLISPFICQ